MRNNSKIQVPLNSKLKKDFVKKCETQGFSSINEAVRLLIHNFTYTSVSFGFLSKDKEFYLDPHIEEASPELEKTLAKAQEEIKKGEIQELNTKDPNWFKRLCD